MSLWLIILLSLAVIVALVVGRLFSMFRKFSTPTTGQKINDYTMPGKALMVIDVQEDFTGLKGRQPVPYTNAEGRIEIINKLIDRADATGVHVVYIRHLYVNNLLTRTFISRGIEGFLGTEIDSRIKRVGTNDFTKKISDAFSNRQLEEFLLNHQVNELYLTGLDAVYCVHKTALGGMNRGYTVHVVTDGIMSRTKMEKILKLYEKDCIGMTTSEELLTN